jgi:hypothetical protein
LLHRPGIRNGIQFALHEIHFRRGNQDQGQQKVAFRATKELKLAI